MDRKMPWWSKIFSKNQSQQREDVSQHDIGHEPSKPVTTRRTGRMSRYIYIDEGRINSIADRNLGATNPELKASAVLQYLESQHKVGTLDQEMGYLYGEFQMRWGKYGSPYEDTGGVYFGCSTRQTIFGMLGREEHLRVTIDDTYVDSAAGTKFLVKTAFDRDYDRLGLALQAVYVATESQGDARSGKVEAFKFLAERMGASEYSNGRRVLLGRPLFVATTNL